MHVFNVNRTLKFMLESMYSGPFTYNSAAEMLLFLFDGSGGVPTTAEEVFPSANAFTLENYTRNCFAYGVLNGQTNIDNTTDVGYRANTLYLTLKAPVIRPGIATGFLDFAGAAVAVPDHKVFTPAWINGTGIGTSTQDPKNPGINKCLGLNHCVSRLPAPYISIGFDTNSSLTAFESLVYDFGSPVTVNCFVLERARFFLGAGGNLARFQVQYLNALDQWITLGTTPVTSGAASARVYPKHYLQFAPVTATKFRLLHNAVSTSSGMDVWTCGYFGNTDTSGITPFTYPSTVYGIAVANNIINGRANGGAALSDVGSGGTNTARSNSQTTAALTDQYSGMVSVTNPPAVMMDAGDLASSARIKLPTLNTDATAFFGFNNVIVDLF